LPPPPGGSFRDFCSAGDTARYLEALRTLEDADIEEGRDDLAQAWSVDAERTTAAIKTLRLGQSYDGTTVVATETYREFLTRSQKTGGCAACAVAPQPLLTASLPLFLQTSSISSP